MVSLAYALAGPASQVVIISNLIFKDKSDPLIVPMVFDVLESSDEQSRSLLKPLHIQIYRQYYERVISICDCHYSILLFWLF